MKSFKITIGDKTYNITADRDTADPFLMKISIDGKGYTVRIEEEERKSSGPRSTVPPLPGSSRGGKIVAQIPGTVLSVEVTEGDSVNAGDKVLILEAMKMENVITTEVGGTVQAIQVKKGDKVEAGQELVEIT